MRSSVKFLEEWVVHTICDPCLIFSQCMNALVNFDGALADTMSVVNGIKQGCFLGPQHFSNFFAVTFKIVLRNIVPLSLDNL